MGLSKLAARCQVCPFIDSCDHKQMEAYGFLMPTQSQQNQTMSVGPDTGEKLIRNDVMDVDELVKHMAAVFQIPEHILRGGE